MEDLSQYIHFYVLSTALYTCLYYLVAARILPQFIPPFSLLADHQSREWISNSASIITAVICGIGALSGLLLEMEPNVKFTILQILVTAMTGYWVCDTIYRINNMHILKNTKFQYFLLFHHLLGIIAVQIAVLHREMMNVKLVFILMELGSLFINIRFCLLDLNVDRDSVVYESVSYAMIATFFLTRLAPAPYMYHQALYKCGYLQENCSVACRPFILFNTLLYSVFTVLNVYWFKVMLHGLAKHSIKKRFGRYSKLATGSSSSNMINNHVTHKQPPADKSTDPSLCR
jgi:hypothetical protein